MCASYHTAAEGPARAAKSRDATKERDAHVVGAIAHHSRLISLRLDRDNEGRFLAVVRRQSTREDFGKRSLEQLFTFLRGQSQTAGPLEMHYCWEGDDGRRAKAAATLELSKFRLPEDTYYLPVRTKIVSFQRPPQG